RHTRWPRDWTSDVCSSDLYVGPSLLEDGRFDPICLKNLRLWQLMLTCSIAVRAHQLRDQLPVPLETTHLILVQHTPRSIRFRFRSEESRVGQGSWSRVRPA